MPSPRAMLLALAGPALGLAAQQPSPQPTPPPTPAPTPAPTPGTQDPKPVDPTNEAARALQQLLGGKPPENAPKPATQDPKPVVPPPAETPPAVTEPLAPSAPAVPEPTGGLFFGGVLSTYYRLRHGAGSTDQDVVTRLNLDVGRAEHDPVTVHLAARAYADLDGSRSDDAFAGLDESLGDVTGHLYLAHVDAHSIPHLALARLGRQDLEEAPIFLTFDGLRADSERFGTARAWVSAYGGVPVHHFEASAHGDSVFGAAFGFSPWDDGRVRIDCMDLRDEYLTTDHHDSLIGISAWQDLGRVQANGLFTWLDGDPRDLHLGARGALDAPLHFDVDYRELLTTQRSQVTELDPFYDIALDYFPFRELDVAVGADLGDRVVVDFGTDVRRLADASDERAFNREFERYHADLTLLDLFERGLSFTLSGSLWNSSGEDFETLAGDLEYRPDRNLRVALGTSYDLYDYDVAAGEERTHVRTWYVRLDRRMSDVLRVTGGYEYERNDDDEFHGFRLEVTWTF